MIATVAQRRLARLCVTRPVSTPADAVTRLLAVQAQDLGAASWAVGLRSGATAAGVAESLESGAVVRTWPMRGTLHLCPAADVRWLLELLAPRVVTAAARRMRELELDEAQIGRCGDRVLQTLAGRRATRDELFADFETIGVSTAGQRGYHLLWHLSQRRVICQAGGGGKIASYALFDDWVPSTRSPEDALAVLAKRYFAGHGPATEADLAWWAGLPLRDVRAGIDGAGLIRETIDGEVHWSADLDDPPPAGVHLLPAFDELLLGYRDRTATLDPAFADRICPGGNGVFRPMVVIDGQTVGTWKVKLTKKEARFSFEGFVHPIATDVVRDAAERYAAFVGREATF